MPLLSGLLQKKLEDGGENWKPDAPSSSLSPHRKSLFLLQDSAVLLPALPLLSLAQVCSQSPQTLNSTSLAVMSLYVLTSNPSCRCFQCKMKSLLLAILWFYTGHLHAPCGPDQLPGTASASHRCWFHAAPNQACTWRSNLPEVSGQNS